MRLHIDNIHDNEIHSHNEKLNYAMKIGLEIGALAISAK